MLELDYDILDALALEDIDKAEGDVRFALSGTLTDLAFRARKEVFRPAVQRAFTLRNRFLTKGIREGARGPGGIGVERATKASMVARVFFGEGAEFLWLHQHALAKMPMSGDFEFFIPSRKAFGDKRVKKGAIVRAARTGRGLTGPMPKGLSRTRAGRTFFAPVDAKSPSKGWRIVRRVPGKEPGKRKTKRGGIRKRQRRAIETLGYMERVGRIRKAIHVDKQAAALAAREIHGLFAKRLEWALKNPKRK